MAIINIGTKEAFDIIDVLKMNDFLLSIKNNLDLKFEQADPNNMWVFKDKQTGEQFEHNSRTSEVLGTLPGAVAIHENGEMDMRGFYCSLVIADVCNILENNEELTRNMGDFIGSCQTYEGGIGCSPFGEAHGGYTFCGLASLILLKETHKIDLHRCLDWLTAR